MSDDAELVASARRGEKKAFAELVRTYQRRVYGTALHITCNHKEADEVTEETFVKAYHQLADFDGRSDFFTWLYRIAVNTGLKQLRRHERAERPARAEEAGGEMRPEPSGGDQDRTARELLELGERFRRVIQGICELSPVVRVTLVLATVERLAYKKIAEIMEVPEGTVAWRVSEARKQLRDRLQESKLEGEESP